MILKRARELLGASVLVLVLSLPASGNRTLCPGNCDGDSSVTIDELVIGVSLAFGDRAVAECPAFDGNEDGFVTVDELVKGVQAALNGCPAEPLETPTEKNATLTPTAIIASSATQTFTPTPTSTQTPLNPTMTSSPTKTPTSLPLLGPRITFLGIARADNTLVPSSGATGNGIPIYERPTNSGFIIVIEGQPGLGGKSLSDFGTADHPATGSARANLQILANNALGNGSSAVCDLGPLPDPIGGVPAGGPMEFDPSQETTNTINDLACRFDIHSLGSACTLDELGNFSFVSEEVANGMRQYCTAPAVGRELAFPSGDTMVIVQLVDVGGNLGDAAKMVVRVP